ncbi:hypothetical protein HMI56_004441 [Coelomomyces lativittatus]|nr:hypothetical protein HMI56_004441 [Coelomomyces lativittatus]
MNYLNQKFLFFFFFFFFYFLNCLFNHLLRIMHTHPHSLLKPVEYIPRPSLLGLGADPSNSSQPPSLKRKSPDYILPRSADGKVRHTKAIDEKLKIKETLQVGSHVKIVYGVHEGLYGFVNELRESEVKITLKNMEKIRVPINYIKLASELAFKKPYTLPVPSVEKSITIPNGYESSWLKQGLRVRIISKILEDGQYYNKKASVLDVLPGNLGVLRVENDKRTVLDQVPQMYLETMIPSVGGKVMILKGTSEVDAGALARVLIKDKKKQECACGLEEDESLVYVFSFNDICEVETNTY